MQEPFIKETTSTLLLNNWADQTNRLVAGFTTKNGGTSQAPYQTNNLGLHVKDDPRKVVTNRMSLANHLGFPTTNWACADQVHADQIVKISKPLAGSGAVDYQDSIKGTDGLYTQEKDLLLALCYADCVPVYFFAPDHQMIGVAHAGWKGTVKNISGKMIELWDLMENIPPKDIHAAIGPSIDSCCYVVDDHVINEVNDVLKSISSDYAPYKEISEGQYQLDLKMLNKLLLLHAGVEEKNILVSNYCTSCQDDLFFSHRRDEGKTGRMLSFIGMKKE
ncbi:laccase [Salipaludibacillus keqinensis]|uniref:Purine nucleoside phosphorylase n=1 Tax=Salipaludibacillus keqinensis TaxID=2045207 RepID=A0A323TMW0_9BACI|nr:peptidoglycan editing factor PgeF [Salipaludibacillus keqinensis]PYZ94043.1 laccase [Salipaludibacillus keqinensis]